MLTKVELKEMAELLGLASPNTAKGATTMKKKTKTTNAETKNDVAKATPKERVAVSPSLADALRDNLSPEAVAAIASWLQPARVSDTSVDQEIGWFRGLLVDALGGYEQQSRLAEELGL